MLESLEPRRLLASLVIFETDDTTSVGESAIAADTFTVALDQPPNSPVVVSIASVDPTQVRVNNTQITFDTSNWDQPQTVTVEGVSDSIDEPDQTIEIAVAVVDELSDEMFHEAIDQSVDVTIVDDDVAGLAFYDVDSVIQLTEDGFSKNFSVALTSEPTSEVRVQLAIDAQQSKIFQPGSIYSIGNSLSWNARPPLLDGDVEYHNDCGKNLQFIFDNPESPCTNTSRLWTDALLNQQYDWVVVQPFFGTTITQDAAVINHWMSLQPDAVFVIHTGWSTHVDRDADYNGGNPNDQMVHSPEYFDDLIAQLQGTQGNQDRVIRSTHAINILDSFYDDFAAGVSPFDDVTTQFYIDHIHMTPLGQYFAHSALRQALRQPLSNLHFRFLTPEVIEYMNSNIEQYSTGADFGSLEIVFDSTNWSTPQSITVSPTDNAELGSIISLVVDPTTADANYAGLPTSSLPVNILALNDRPRFELSGDVLVNEDSGLSTITDLFAAIDTGPGEDDQTVIGYHATNLSDESLFDTLPSFDETGNLIFSSKKDAVGSATLEISIQDDGGTENGTHDTSLPQLLTITIAPVNDPPTFTMINPPVIGKNAGPQIVEGFIREIILGPNDESTQSLMSVSVVNIDRPELFETPPTIDLDGKLHYTPAANQFGTSTFSVTIQDNGGTNAGGRDVSDSQTFTIEIDAANAGPSILGPTRVTSLQPFDLLIDFREPVDGFLLQDTVIAGGNAIQMVDMGNGVYKVTIVPNGEDLITFDVPAGVATNSEGVPNTAATQYVVSVVPIPTPVISGPTNPINANRFDVTIDFGESVSGFSLNEIDVTGGNAINAVIHGGGLFTATIQPNGEGTVIVDIAEGAAKDHDGNPSLAATSYTVVGDTITPTPIISGPNSLTNSPQFDITIDFGETVNGFNLREIDVTGGDAINAVIQGDGVYTVTIVAIGDGTVTI
ncbi:Ig-like domain-containing protein, partial [Novipirellula sp.]|uniref:Ig-like domain-containing protein n=1 Tax=Novipirellula sp. TaxID=2795430 RepID=UPI00356B32A0